MLLGLSTVEKKRILQKVIIREKDLAWLAHECDHVRIVARIQQCFVEQTQCGDWNSAINLWPTETSERSLNRWILIFQTAEKGQSKRGRKPKTMKTDDIPAQFVEW